MQRPSIRRGEELVLDVDQVGEAGDGLARVNDFPIFVGGALAGERVRAKVVAVHEAHARAEILAIEQASPDRVEPQCRHVETCGGCRFQHLTDSARRARKLRRAESALRRHLGSDMPALEELAETPAYRARCRLALRVVWRGERMRIGRSDRAGVVFALDECPATCDGAFDVAHAIVGEAVARKLPGLRAVVTHASADGAQVQVTLVADTARLPHAQRLGDVARAAGATGVCLNQHDGREDRMFGKRTTALLGRPYLVETVGDMPLRISATTFFETTHHGATTMAGAVAHAAGVTGESRVVDLFAGSGSFSLTLARAGANVVAVETGRQALYDAEGSAHDLGLERVRFVGDRAEQQVIALERFRPTVVVADPPRSGCSDEVVAGVARILTPRRVVLVGRDPGTLGRDAARFVALGYRATRIEPVDTDPLAQEMGAVIALERDTD